MVTAKMTSKGQLTIPKTVRDRLHLQPGDRVAFAISDDGEATMKPITKSVDEVFGKLHRAGQSKKSVEEMKAAVAARMKRRTR